MNIFVPQSIQTQIELQEIADVQRQIILPKNSVPIIGIVQDGLLGAYNLTQDDVEIDWRDAMNIMSYTTVKDLSSIKKGKKYTGRELASMIIPNKINTTSGGIKVKNGKIQEGSLSSAMLGAKKGNSLIHLIWDEYGPEEARKFLDNIQKLVNNFNLINGFSVGVGDIDVSKEVEEQIHNLFETKKVEIDHFITEIENNPDLLDQDAFENNVLSELNAVRDTVSKLIMNNLKPKNNFNIMISSGSKGSAVNMGQMGGCVGQQMVEGKRVAKKCNGRALPYFTQNDDSGLGRGLVTASFYRGIDPVGFIFHNMGSREGLIDTAIKSVTGDTPIVIMENGKINRVLIGDWIDGQLRARKDEVEHHEERDMELLNLKNQVFIPTADEDGKVTWGDIKAITRHDPGKELYQIKTYGGKSVIVTESKSLLIWNKDTEKFERMSTPDVVVGDFVPVTMNLSKPPIEIDHINVEDYFPKTEYLYGSDFLKAKEEFEKALIGREKIIRGWWEKNNGKMFTLPYDCSHKLRRVTRRSNLDNIKEGYVYPFSSTRESVLIPEKLELNRDNGLFIGLFLAEGNVDIPSGYVQITNNNPRVRNFTKKWLEGFAIKFKENSKINQIGGLTSDVRGYSTLLAKFLTKLVGHGARNKYVPHEAFNAPDEFIIGLLDGYFSGDGSVGNGCVFVSSASERLIEGISMLCSRLGIFGRVTKGIIKENNVKTKDIAPRYTLSIRGQWAQIFSNRVSLIDDKKNVQLKNIKPSKCFKNFPFNNDCVLDKIVEINKIDVAKYPKVYDLTVPSTLNFGLANGLHVVDTAESGYIQRKLIKSMEDISVKNDCTVRNSNNTIIQFSYGDSSVDTIKQYSHNLNILQMGNTELEDKFKFTSQEMKNFKSFPDADNDRYVKMLMHHRNLLRKTKMKVALSNITFELAYMLPVNLKNIVNNIKSYESKKSEKLEPDYIIKKLDDILDYKNTKIGCLTEDDYANKKSLRYQDEMLVKYVFKLALHEYLAPKVTIFELGLDKEQFDRVCNQIIRSFNKSIVEPGEMVGIIAAQSIGEPKSWALKWFCH